MTTPNVEKALLRIKELPTLPSVLGKVLVTAADPEASALDLGKHIAADQSLSATILKLVNSSYYGFYRQIKSVSHAIVMLGFLEVRNLALTATAFKTLGKSASGYDHVQLWRHSLAAAMAAERLQEMLGSEIEGAFEAGLLHDIGKVALDLLYPGAYGEAVAKARQEARYIREVEEARFGLDHARAGGILAEHWNLPGPVVEAIRRHHAPEACEEDARLVQLTVLANYVTYEAECGESGNGLAPAFPETAALELDCAETVCAQVAGELLEKRDAIDEFLGVIGGR